MSINLKDVRLGARVEVRPKYGKEYKPGFVYSWTHQRFNVHDARVDEYFVTVKFLDGTEEKVDNHDAMAGCRIRYPAPKFPVHEDVDVKVNVPDCPVGRWNSRFMETWVQGRVLSYEEASQTYTILTGHGTVYVDEEHVRNHVSNEDDLKEQVKKLDARLSTEAALSKERLQRIKELEKLLNDFRNQIGKAVQ